MQDFHSATPDRDPATSAGHRNLGDAHRRATAGTPADMSRLVNLPVQISVRLAEKKIEVGQLLSLTHGALITFNKPCEDLLDLYVNNRLFCRGEAVKIGEKFGLKINEVGAVSVRETRVISE